MPTSRWKGEIQGDRVKAQGLSRKGQVWASLSGVLDPGLYFTLPFAQETGYAFSFLDLIMPIWNQFSSKTQTGKGYQKKSNANSLKDKRPALCPLLAGLKASSPDGQSNTSFTTSH